MHINWLKIQICVLGCMLRSHGRNGNECQTPCRHHSVANIEIPGFLILVNPKLVWNSWNLVCYHGAASRCRGNFFPFGTGLGISFSQTRASHNKLDGFGRERATFGDEMISVAYHCFQKISSVNIEQKECCVQSWIFWGSFSLFNTLTGFSRHFMCIIQIWTRSTCSNAPKLVEKSHVCPWVNF